MLHCRTTAGPSIRSVCVAGLGQRWEHRPELNGDSKKKPECPFQTLWSGEYGVSIWPRVRFGRALKLSLVSCPIALYPALAANERISFRQVNKQTGNRLRHQLVDAVTGEQVESTTRRADTKSRTTISACA